MPLFSGQKPPEDEATPQPPAEDVRPRHTVGALLRETRESYGGDIERIAAALRIRAPYLVALEEDRYDRLPAPVYALGFVRAYAIHLGLDGEEAVRRFKQEASGFEIPRDLIFPVPLADRGIPRRPILAAPGCRKKGNTRHRRRRAAIGPPRPGSAGAGCRDRQAVPERSGRAGFQIHLPPA